MKDAPCVKESVTVLMYAPMFVGAFQVGLPLVFEREPATKLPDTVVTVPIAPEAP